MTAMGSKADIQRYKSRPLPANENGCGVSGAAPQQWRHCPTRNVSANMAIRLPTTKTTSATRRQFPRNASKVSKLKCLECPRVVQEARLRSTRSTALSQSNTGAIAPHGAPENESGCRGSAPARRRLLSFLKERRSRDVRRASRRPPRGPSPRCRRPDPAGRLCPSLHPAPCAGRSRAAVPQRHNSQGCRHSDSGLRKRQPVSWGVEPWT
jgi:hypothetical protein